MLRWLLRLIACFAIVSCSREPASPVTDKALSSAVQPAATGDSKDAPAPDALEQEPPAESSLAIKRGVVTLASERTTYLPCDEKSDLWLLDQTDGVLRQAFPRLPEDSKIYVEAYGERTQVPQDVATARGYAGALILEEVLYAAQLTDGQTGCEAQPPAYIVAARGGEPFWSAEIREKDITWRQAEAPKELLMQIPAAADAEGTVSYRGIFENYELQMDIEGLPCRDAASGEYFAYSARASLNGREYNGCARVGS